MNIAMIALMVIGAPMLLFLLQPKTSENKEYVDLLISNEASESVTIKEEASKLRLPLNLGQTN